MSGDRAMEPRYEPHGVEERWQRTWEEEGLYDAEPDPSRTPFVDCHPPQNVTGRLHTGHALSKLATMRRTEQIRLQRTELRERIDRKINPLVLAVVVLQVVKFLHLSRRVKQTS